MLKRLLFLFIAMVVASQAPLAQAQNEAYPDSLDQAVQQIQALPWEHENKDYVLSRSHSTIGLPDNFFLLRNQSARKFMFLNHGIRQPDTEAVLFNPDTINQIIFSYHETGYVTLNSWSDLDSDQILKTITQLTEKDNVSRRQHGLDEAKVLGWIQEPTLDRQNQTVHWIFSLKEGPRKMVNAVVIKLGRKGFERIIWVAPYSIYKSSDGLIQQVMAKHSFQSNFRYADRTVSDRMAGFGIANLVNAITGNGN